MRRTVLMIRLAVLLIGAALLANSAMAGQGPWRVIDGDTIDWDGIPVRIQAIDTPETWKPRCKNEYWLGTLAKQRLQQLLESGGDDVAYIATGYDRFGRVLANVYSGKIDVGMTLMQEGYALPYIPGPKAKAARLAVWCPPDGSTLIPSDD